MTRRGESATLHTLGYRLDVLDALLLDEHMVGGITVSPHLQDAMNSIHFFMHFGLGGYLFSLSIHPNSPMLSLSLSLCGWLSKSDGIQQVAVSQHMLHTAFHRRLERLLVSAPKLTMYVAGWRK